MLDVIRAGKAKVMGIIRSRTAPAPAPAAKPAPAAPAAKGDAKAEKKPMNTAPKPFVEPTGLDFSGPKKNPIPVMPSCLKPAGK